MAFSLDLACRLIDLCVTGETHDNLVTFTSKADPSDILNVKSTTQVTAIPFGKGHAYGPLLNSYRQESPNLPKGKQLILAGHGIAAAYSLLAAVELPSVEAVYTFGAPRLGDKHFVRHFPCPVYRVVNDLDIMPTLPPPWSWRHIGQQKLINADGTLNESPNPLNRLPSLARQSVWLCQMLRQGLSSGYPRSLYTLLTRVLNDHAVESYQTRLHALRQSMLNRDGIR